MIRLLAKVDCQTQSSREGGDRKQCWYYENFFDLNLLVWRHFRISSVLLFNDVAGHAWRIAHFSVRHSMQALAPGW